MIITNIKRNKTLYYISIDDIPTLIITDEAQFKLNLKVGDEFLPDENTVEILREDEIIRCKSKAFSILSYAQKTEKKLKERLKELEFSDEAIEETLSYLKENNYINDVEIGEIIVKRENSLNKSKSQIKQKLYVRGISKENIQILLEEADLDEKQNAYKVAERKYNSVKNYNINDIIKKIRYSLSYKGFSYEATKYAIDKIKKKYNDEREDYD